MSQVSSTLRRTQGGYAHWCPGCEEMHGLRDSWKFDGNLETPTFTPSFKHDGIKRVFVEGKWTGEWVRDANGNTVPYVCHYILTAGILNFCGDSTHALAGKAVTLPRLPEHLQDFQEEQGMKKQTAVKYGENRVTANLSHYVDFQTPRNPSAGDKVLISFGVTNHLCEVLHPWLQLHWLSPDGHTAVVVKEYPGKIYPHKSKGDGAPYWEWPA